MRELICVMIIRSVVGAEPDWCRNHDITSDDQLMSHSEAMAFCNAQGKMLLFPEHIHHECLAFTSENDYWLDGTRHMSSGEYYHAHSKALLKTSLYKDDDNPRSAQCAVLRQGTWSGTDCTNKLRPICQHPKFEFDIITNLWSGADKSDNVKTLRRMEQNDDAESDDGVSPYVILIVCLLLLGLIMAITILVMPRKLYNLATRNTIFHEPQGYSHINNV